MEQKEIKIFKGLRRTPYLTKVRQYAEPAVKIVTRLATPRRLGDRILINDQKFKVVGPFQVVQVSKLRK